MKLDHSQNAPATNNQAALATTTKSPEQVNNRFVGTSHSPLNQTPPEIKGQMMSHLEGDPKSLLHASLINKNFHAVAQPSLKRAKIVVDIRKLPNLASPQERTANLDLQLTLINTLNKEQQALMLSKLADMVLRMPERDCPNAYQKVLAVANNLPEDCKQLVLKHLDPQQAFDQEAETVSTGSMEKRRDAFRNGLGIMEKMPALQHMESLNKFSMLVGYLANINRLGNISDMNRMANALPNSPQKTRILDQLSDAHSQAERRLTYGY